MWRKLWARPNFRYFIFCTLIVAVVFADVVFKKTSISMMDQIGVSGLYRDVHTLYPEKHGLQPYEGFFDISGAALQSEPAIQFMRDVIYHLQSPYWNPYSGSGAFGPETMVDIKFSPVTLSVALLGGSNLAFHFVMLLFYTLALFFFVRVVIQYLGFSLETALAGCAVFLLNGYFVANISSNTNQALLYFPFALFAVLRFSQLGNFKNYVLLVLGYIFPLLVTFLPTTVLMITVVCTLAAASSVSSRGTWRARLQLLAVHASAPVLAGLLLAFLYLPLAEALKFVGGVEQYSARIFSGSNIWAFIALFSPRNFYESYNGINPIFLAFMKNTIFHFGIVSGIITFTALLGLRWYKNIFFASAVILLCLSLGRIFEVLPISWLVDRVPIYKNFGGQYWWMMVGCTFPLVFVYGMEALRADLESSERPNWMLNKMKIWPVVLIAASILGGLIYAGMYAGLPHGGDVYLPRSRSLKYIAFAVFLIFGTIGIVWSIKKRPLRRTIFSRLLVILIFVEMIFYFNTARFRRSEIFRHPPEYISFLKEHVGLNRVAAYGSTGLPPEMGSAYQIQQLEFFTMNIFPSYYQLCQRALTTERGWWGKDTFCVNRDHQNPPLLNPGILDLLSVRYMVVSRAMPQYLKYFDEHKYPRVFNYESLVIFENPNAFPRIFVTPHIEEAPLTPETKGQDARDVVFTQDAKLLEEAKAKGIVQEGSKSGVPLSLFSAVKILEYRNASLVAEAEMSSPGVLALMDNWNPNWKAIVDGKPAYIGKIDQSFRGIALAAGHHTIEMSYRPSTLSVALGISFMSLFGLIGVGLFWSRKNWVV